MSTRASCDNSGVHGGYIWVVFLLHTEKAQVVEAELMDIHRDEVSQLKQLIAQKDEELQKNVQKYEQVIQVQSQERAWGLVLLMVSHFWIKWINPTQHLEAISVGGCPLSCGFL